MNSLKKRSRPRVRVENIKCAAGYVGHMTTDEIKSYLIGDYVDLACPVCGLVHLTLEEAEAEETRKITESERYKQILKEAIAKK